MRSKFGRKTTLSVIDGLCDSKAIADRFADAFKAASVPNCIERHKHLEADFWKRFSPLCCYAALYSLVALMLISFSNVLQS